VKRFRELLRASSGEEHNEEPAQDDCTLTVTAEREETWLGECARIIHRHMEGGSTTDFMEALVFEGVSTLRELLPKHAVGSEELVPDNAAQNAWSRQLARYRDEAEAIVDANVLARRTDGLPSELCTDETDFEGPPSSIDQGLRKITGQLAERELRIGELAERFWKADGWRRLRYATAAQYARERLGMSLTCIKDRRQLGRPVSRLPVLKEAFLNGHIGYEALRLTAAVATPQTDAAWAVRARERTLVHLHEDIRAAELLARVGRREAIEPPCEEIVTELRSLETSVVTGAVFRDEGAPGASRKSVAIVDALRDSLCTGARVTCTAPPRDAESAHGDLTALWTAFAEARRAPSQLRSLARDVQRFRVRPDVRDLYRGVERQYLRLSSTALVVFPVPVPELHRDVGARIATGCLREHLRPRRPPLHQPGVYEPRLPAAPREVSLTGRRGRTVEPDDAVHALPPGRRARRPARSSWLRAAPTRVANRRTHRRGGTEATARRACSPQFKPNLRRFRTCCRTGR
jgi:hypothetical protein